MNKDETLKIEELQTYINKLRDELKSKNKYGLVWDKEDTTEESVQKCLNEIPVLATIKEKDIWNGRLNNVLIEGDNYYSLVALNYILKNSIDLIYIDPPYNTGSNNFVYNDNFVNYDDGFFHSKWISFMEKRLKLARDLLKDDGLIFVSIDDNEQANLKLLMDMIFGKFNFVSTFIIDKTAQGANQSVTFKTQHEYCLLYKKKMSDKINYEIESECDNKKFKYRDNKGLYAITNSFDSINSPLSSNKNRGYTIYYRESDGDAQIRDEFNKETLTFGDYDQSLIANGYIPIRPGIRKNVQYPWNWEPGRFLREYKQELVFCKNKKGIMSVYHKNRFSGKTKDTTIKKFDTRQQGNQLLVDILGTKKFDYPKSLDMMKWVVSKHSSKDALILDFFAGSGTTGQAVLELNKEDGGNRRFILCTNNENNICTEVCYPRLKTVITGKRADGTKYSGDISSNLIYYKTDFVKDQANRDSAKYSLVAKCNGLLCILEDCYDLVEQKNDWFHYSSEEKDMYIYNDFCNEETFCEMEKSILSSKKPVILYVFSTDENLDGFDLSNLKNTVVKPIPSKIYEIYKEIVEEIKRG